MELHHIRDINDPLVKVIADDPVRPHIPLEQRINDAAEILLLKIRQYSIPFGHTPRAQVKP
jgi:hypothetical protein